MRTLVRSAASNYAALLAQVAQLVLLTPLLIRQIGPEALGAWTLILAVLGYLRLVEAGYGPSLARFVAASDAARRVEVQRTGIRMAWFVALASLVLGEAAALASTTVDVADGFSYSLAVAVLGRAIQAPAVAAGWILFGAGEIALRSALQTARVLLATVCMAGALLADGGLVGFTAAGMAAEILASGVLVGVCRRRIDGFDLRWRRTDPGLRREMTRFSGGVFAFTFAAQIVTSSDALVISAFFGTSTLALYAIAMRIVEGLSTSLSQGTDVLLPSFTAMRGDRERLVRSVALAVRVSVVISFSFVAVFAAVGQPLLRLWVGEGFDESQVLVLLLSGGLLFNVPLRIVVLAALGTGDHQRIVRLALVEAFTNICLSLIFATTLGVRGVALASLITFSLFNGVLMPRRLLPAMGLRRGFIQDVSWRAAVVAAPIALAGNVTLGDIEPSASIPAAALLMGLSLVSSTAVVFIGDARADAVRALRSLRRSSSQAPPS